MMVWSMLWCQSDYSSSIRRGPGLYYWEFARGTTKCEYTHCGRENESDTTAVEKAIKRVKADKHKKERAT